MGDPLIFFSVLQASHIEHILSYKQEKTKCIFKVKTKNKKALDYHQKNVETIY